MKKMGCCVRAAPSRTADGCSRGKPPPRHSMLPLRPHSLLEKVDRTKDFLPFFALFGSGRRHLVHS
jgi:hypothetical protein